MMVSEKEYQLIELNIKFKSDVIMKKFGVLLRYNFKTLGRKEWFNKWC